jgi:hypothetical protein
LFLRDNSALHKLATFAVKRSVAQSN